MKIRGRELSLLSALNEQTLRGGSCHFNLTEIEKVGGASQKDNCERHNRKGREIKRRKKNCCKLNQGNTWEKKDNLSVMKLATDNRI